MESGRLLYVRTRKLEISKEHSWLLLLLFLNERFSVANPPLVVVGVSVDVLCNKVMKRRKKCCLKNLN
jgi:hypothetical protein